MNKLIKILIVFMLVSCATDKDGFRRYTVPAGKHKCKTLLPKVYVNKHSLQFDVKVNNEWLNLPANGWNKVTGISEGNHRNNSCRLVTKPAGGKILMGMYVWADGEREMFTIDTVQPGTYSCNMGRISGTWYMFFNGKAWAAPAGKRKNINYLLRPYVGGTNVMNKDWNVWIKYY